VIIGLIWLIWFLNCIFNQVIMLNFMISIINQSYERVMAQKNQLMYQYKCDLNMEVEIFMSYFERFCWKKRRNFNSILVITAGDPDDDGEWSGFCSQVRKLIGHVLQNQSFYQDKASVKLDKLVDMQLEMQGQMETAQEGNNKLLKQEMQGINIQLSQMARSLASMVEVVDTVQEECKRKRSQEGDNGKPEERAPEQVKDKEEGVAVQDGGGAERDGTA